jgi:hypothetical protein
VKYSIIGYLNGIEEDSIESYEIFDTINSVNPIWRLLPLFYIEEESKGMTFEVWLDSEENKNICYDIMTNFVDTYTGSNSFHICTHDEETPKPCVIMEAYKKE